MKRPFRVRGGRLRVDLEPEVLELLAGIPDLLENVGGDGDPATRRLAPVAHPGDPAAARAYDELTDAELARARNVDRAGFVSSLEAVRTRRELDIEEADMWLRVIGEARLVLGARLGISEDGWEADAGADPRYAILGYLGYLQEDLVHALNRLMFGGG